MDAEATNENLVELCRMDELLLQLHSLNSAGNSPLGSCLPVSLVLGLVGSARKQSDCLFVSDGAWEKCDSHQQGREIMC